MNHLLRALAPISEETWGVLDEEAKQRLEPALAQRRLIDFRGPHGWEDSGNELRPDGSPRLGPDLRRRGTPAAGASSG